MQHIDGFEGIDGIVKEFSNRDYSNNYEPLEADAKPIRDALNGSILHVAWYGFGSYDGEAFILYEKDGKLYEVNASHCSCNGLEEQWRPEETTWEALAHVVYKGAKFSSDYSSGAKETGAAMRQLLAVQGFPEPVEAK